MAIAWVFPGQGSQKVGMAEALLSIDGSRERFAMASELLGRDLLAICQGESGGGDGPDDLNDTRNTQPALFVIESLLADNLQQQGRKPALVAGHSLGELVALHSAGVFELETGLQLMKTRSELMASAGGGAMTAVIGFDRAQLDDLVAATDGVSIANDNSDVQVVISGSPEAVEHVSGALKCKRAIPLAVSGAFHSPFMAEAAERFAAELDNVPFLDARVPVLSNSAASASTSADELKQRLKQQMTTGVRWRETMAAMTESGVDTLVEIGPGNVLSGLAKRSMSGVTTAQISGAGDLGQ
ncbi:malonyl CoA-acyl carrier protein transacylase (MCAT) [Synechococcus sp. A15-62]|uniref:ACP S-malonyltransferase n=1 Tax=Synechococcus sp. A15-62 TaxID=1050657 RepID=UPI00164854D6|nr:ACP S-malonyltransferase [Synechococcus sp. A15-62]QNJ01364.1 malonyl CoA-acyl carrier protein transacylase (MCAT) [Synechococcus sp. A15-62]